MSVPVNVKIDRATTNNLLIIGGAIVLLLVVLIIVWNVRKKIKNKIEDSQAGREVKEANKRDENIADDTGLNVSEVRRARQVAHATAKALNTHVDSGFFTFGEDEDLAIASLNRVVSEDEMILVAEMYMNEATTSRNLRSDLISYLWASQRKRIKLFYALT